MKVYDPKSTHLIFVGARTHNIVPDRILCSYDYFEGDNAKTLRSNVGFSRVPDVIIAFKDFLHHRIFDLFKEKAKTLNIPLICVKGGLGAQIEDARQRGHDLSRCVRLNGRAPLSSTPKKGAALPLQATEVAPEAPPTKDSGPKAGFFKALPTPHGTINVMAKRGGGLTVVLSGVIFDEIIRQVERNNLHKEEWIKPTELKRKGIIGHVRSKFGLDGTEIRISSRMAARKLNDHYKKVWPHPKKRATKKPEPKPAPPEEPKPAPPRAPKELEPASGKAVDPRLTTPAAPDPALPSGDLLGIMQKWQEQADRMHDLYRQVTDLKVENTAFMEQIDRLEQDKTKLSKQLEDLRMELKKWKDMAAS